MQAVSGMMGAYLMSSGLMVFIEQQLPQVDVVEDMEGIILCSMAQSFYAFVLILIIDRLTRGVDEESSEAESSSGSPVANTGGAGRGRSSVATNATGPSAMEEGASTAAPSQGGGWYRKKVVNFLGVDVKDCPVVSKTVQQLIFSCGVLIGSGWER